MRVATYYLEDGREIDIMKGQDGKYYACDAFARSSNVTGVDNFPSYKEIQEQFKDEGEPEQHEREDASDAPYDPIKAEEFKSQLVVDFGSHRADDRIVVLKLSDTRFYAGYVVGYDRTSGTYHETQNAAHLAAGRMDERRRQY